MKCPYKCRTMSMSEITEQPDQCLNAQYDLKQSHEYYAQVQLQMFVCDTDYADFVIWTPIDCVITRVVKDMKYIDILLVKIITVWHKAILPELLTCSLEMDVINRKINVTPSTSTATTNDTLYCICRQPENGDMVGGDACDEWFHLKCLKLKRQPTAKHWYCKQCRVLKSRK